MTDYIDCDFSHTSKPDTVSNLDLCVYVKPVAPWVLRCRRQTVAYGAFSHVISQVQSCSVLTADSHFPLTSEDFLRRGGGVAGGGS